MARLHYYLLVCLFFFSNKIYTQDFSIINGASLPASGYSTIFPGDFNNDGLIDLVFTGEIDAQPFAKIYKNKGDSSFVDMGVGLPQLNNYSIHVNDFDNDGWLDLLISGVNDENETVFYIFKNQQNETFLPVNHTIPGLRYGYITSGDINLNGYADIFISGLTSQGAYTAVYKNNGDMDFSKIDYDFEGVYDGGAAIADLNNDGLPDIVYSGMNSSYRKETYIIINKGNRSFENKSCDLPGIRAGKVEVADVNNDGYLDIALFGNDNDDNYILKIYKNVYGSAFTLISELQGIINGDIHFGDFNMSGYPDLLATGKKQSGQYQSTLYENNSGLSFTETGFSITDITNSACRWFDFNNDSKLDFIISGNEMAGPVTELYANNNGLSNHQPEAPGQLMHTTNMDTVLLQWDAPHDNEQASESLTYDIRVVDKTNSRFIFIPPADTANGKRKVVKHGLFTDTSCTINLPEGKYSWSVQAIDQVFEGSDFAPIDSFVICLPVSAGNDTSVCYSEQVSFSVADVDGTAEWYSVKNPETPFSTDKSIDIQVLESDTIWVDVTKDFGVVVSDTVIVTMNALPTIDTGDDQYVCPGGMVELEVGAETDIVNWNTASGDYSATDTVAFVNYFYSDDQIFVQLTDSNGCAGYDTLAVFMNEIPQINLVNDTAICKLDSIHLALDNINDSINWYSYQDELLLANSAAFDLYVDKTDTLIVEAYNTFGCVNYDTIKIRARELPVADAGKDKLICEGYDVVIGPESPNESYAYLWLPDEHINDIHLPNPRVNPVVDSKYYVEVADSFGCVNNDSVLVRINPPGVFDIGTDTSICPGGNVMLGGNPTADGSILPYNYEWSPTESLSGFTTANPVAFPDETTTYTLIIYTGDCPVDTLETTVTVHPLPEISIMNDTLAGYKEDIPLWADGGIEYEWYPGEFLDNPYIHNPVANLDQTTLFTVQVTNTYGCSDTAGVKIMVKNELFIPEMFTPNNDGNNDYFKVYGFGIKELHITIYNQQGMIVYESNHLDEILNTGWNGEKNGNPVKEGKYFWEINGEFYNGDPLLFNGKNTGVVTILR